MNTTGVNLTIWKDARYHGSKTRREKSGVDATDNRSLLSRNLGTLNFICFKASGTSILPRTREDNDSHRLWVLENSSEDPLEGSWEMKGKLSGPDDLWAIDASVFENGGKSYALWSGWTGHSNGVQKILIAELAQSMDVAQRSGGDIDTHVSVGEGR